jgi:hypothetical protein
MTPKAQFAQRCEAFLKEWENDLYQRYVEAAVRRLCSDERARSLWALCKTLDDEAFRNVMESLVPFSEPKLKVRELQQQPQRDYEQTAQRLEIVRRFLALITDPQEGLSLPWSLVRLTPEYYVAQTRALERGLAFELNILNDTRREAGAIYSRKGIVPNTLSALAHGMKTATGNLHLDVVADVASIFLDRVITADQVRKARTRAEARWQKWRAHAEERRRQRDEEYRRRFAQNN